LDGDSKLFHFDFQGDVIGLKAWISDEMDEATRKNIKQRLPWRQG
jgi:hypothetical protein